MLLGKDVMCLTSENRIPNLPENHLIADYAGFSTVSDVDEECPVAYPASVKHVVLIWDVTTIAFMSWPP